MKIFKYLAAAFLLCAGMISCGNETGTVGTTTIQFADAVMKSGFGGAYVYVPLTITADTEAAMNSADVTAKLSIVADHTPTTSDAVLGVADTDFMVTSLDVNFPAYQEYYDKENPKKYYNEELGKWIKTVQMEVKLLNTEPEIMEFKFAIESATTTIGANSECVVRLEKSATDRLCGEYAVTSDANSPFGVAFNSFTATISWNSGYNCFEIFPFSSWNYCPVYAYWDEETEQMYMLPYEPLMWYSSSDMQMCYQMFFSVANQSIQLASDNVVLDVDLAAGTIKFPTDLYFGILVFGCDEGYNPNSLVGYFTGCDSGHVFTKK